MEPHDRKGVPMACESDGVEREVKFGVGPSFVLPDLGDASTGTASLPDQELRAEYLDTGDRRLWRQDITLRFRTGEHAGRGTWTLKLPAAGSGPTLDRIELSWPGTRDSFPTEAAEILRGLLRGSSLDRLVELVTTRRRLALHDAHGAKWGELDDDTVAVIGGPRNGLRFRQIELELTPDGRSELDRVMEKLAEAGAIVDNQPKVAIALGRAGSASADDRAPIDGRASLGDVIQASIAGALDRILENDYRLRLDPSDPPPHSVHHGRVATRRLRSDLKTLGPVLNAEWTAHIRAELQWLGEAFGRVRDADVLARHLSDARTALSEDAEGIDELSQRLADQRHTASRQLAEALDSTRYLDLLDQLHTAVRAAPFASTGRPERSSPDPRVTDPARRALPPLVRTGWRALRRKVDRAGSQPSDVELHRIRIAAKQVRYAAEMAAPVIGEPARLTAAAAGQLQTVLGNHQDAVMAIQWLRRQGLAGSPAAGFAAGLLTAQQYGRQEELRCQWRPVCDSLDSKKARGWIS
ncbi:MAG TPA: CYTH and CHAD domain-containing protein [Acidimicrobiales bacterium]|nr:CYTH and CHAD domain-containing protein [Acidimicrobiales bacterium]